MLSILYSSRLIPLSVLIIPKTVNIPIYTVKNYFIVMTKTVHYMLLLTICFCKTIEPNNTPEIPGASFSLFKGISKGSGLEDLLGLTNCESDYYDFIYLLANKTDSIIHNNENLLSLGEVIIAFSTFRSKCKINDDVLQIADEYLHHCLTYPKKFLISFFDKLLSVYSFMKYCSLRLSLSQDDYYTTGVTLGEVLNHLLKIDFKYFKNLK
jgi:hypothetical protein